MEGRTQGRKIKDNKRAGKGRGRRKDRKTDKKGVKMV